MCFTSNGTEHHTSHFDLMTRHISPHLVVRRGQPYQLDIVLSRGYNPTTDAISFIFTLAGKLIPIQKYKTVPICMLSTVVGRINYNEYYNLCIIEIYSTHQYLLLFQTWKVVEPTQMNKHILLGQNRISAVQSEQIYLQEIMVVIVLHFQQYSFHLTETIEKTKN